MNPGLTAGEALGNRFLLVEASGLEGANPSALARERCGDGDGLLVMGSEGPEARTVEIWNRDGSAGGPASMACGWRPFGWVARRAPS